jgi:integrase
MARPATGQVVERPTTRGRSFALRFRAYGRREYLTLGTAEDGWSPDRAEAELQNVLADVRRGIWQPAGPAPAPEPTFHEFASEWFEQRRNEVRPSTAEAVRWRLSCVLLPFFASHRLSQITTREVDRYRQAQVLERDRLRTLRDAQASLPVAERQRLSRPLSNATINRTIALLGQILELAVEYDLIAANPARGRRRLLKADKPSRAYLDSAEQIAALLDAARELDSEAREDRRHVARRPLLATLTFAGLRIGELLELRWRDVDLAAGWITVRNAKTDAGMRKVKIRPALRDELLAHKASTAHDSSAAFVFGTSEGKRQSAGNVRVRVLVKALERADEHLAEDGKPPLPAVTPHGLRRSFASILYAIGEPPPVVMAEMGHTDPSLALAIYAQAMRRDSDEDGRLRALLEGAACTPEMVSREAEAQEPATAR